MAAKKKATTRTRYRLTVAGGNTVGTGEQISRLVQEGADLLQRGYTLYLRQEHQVGTLAIRQRDDAIDAMFDGAPKEPEWVAKARSVLTYLTPRQETTL